MSRMPFYDPYRVPFQRTDGLFRPEGPYGEPGTWHDNTDSQSETGWMDVLTQITDAELTGSDPSTGTWVFTVTPLTDQHGAASAAGLGPASITVVADADTLDDVVLAAIAAAATAAGLETPEELASWQRFLSYVTLSVSPTDGDTLRVTANASGSTFALTVTFDGASSATQTAIATPGTDVLTVGTYVALDADRTGGSHNEMGQPFLELITTETSAANYLGPIMLGTDTDAIEAGAMYQTYSAGVSASLAIYGHPRVYGEKAIPVSSINTPVYVRKAASGTLRAGMATDATGAALGATANLWTGTPTAVDSTLYRSQVTVTNNLGVVVSEEIEFTSGAGTTATLIVTGLKANLLLKPALTGLVAGSGTATLILTGPADGRAVTVTNSGPGTIAWVETTPEVSTHILHPRGDKFLAASPAIGPVPISIPHP
jgi:hypothetical protein